MELNEDTEFRDVKNILRQLQQVKAPANFEADLMRRINSEKYPVEKNFWQTIFIPSRIIPAAALALTAILLIFILNDPGLTQESPFSTTPRERQDVTLSLRANKIAPLEKNMRSDEVSSPKSSSGIQQEGAAHSEPVDKAKDSEKENPVTMSDKGNIAENKSADDEYIHITFASGRITDYPVKKAGLNFRQVNLSNEQKTELNQLKEQMELMYRDRLK